MFHAKSTDNSEIHDTVFTEPRVLSEILHHPARTHATVGAAARGGLKSLTLVAALTIVAGLSPWLLPNPAPPSFTAEARLGVGTKADNSSETRALIQDHIGILTSQAGLDRVVRDLDLAADPAFDTRKQGSMDVLLDLVLGKEGSFADGEAARRDRLLKAMHVAAGPAEGQVTIAVTTGDARQSARIANYLAKLFVADMAQTTTAGLDEELEDRRVAIESAQAALTAFTSAENPTALTDARRIASDLGAVDHQIDATQARLASLNRQAGDAKVLTLADITDKPNGEAMDSPVLADLHQKYVAATMSVDQLSAALGPRHPRLLAAQSAVAQVRKDIQAALGRLGASVQEQIKANGKDAEAFRAKRAKLVAAQQATGVDVARLQTLEAALDTARQDYLDYVQLQETAAPKTRTIAAGILSSADPASAAVTGVSVTALSTSAALAGLGLGLCIVMIRLAMRPTDEADVVPAAITPTLPALEPGFLAEFIHEPIATPPENRPVIKLQPLPQREPRHLPPANISPLADHIRDVLQGGIFRPAEEVHVSPLNDDIRDLRLEMAALRERVADYTTRRSVARG